MIKHKVHHGGKSENGFSQDRQICTTVSVVSGAQIYQAPSVWRLITVVQQFIPEIQNFIQLYPVAKLAEDPDSRTLQFII